MCAVKRRWSSAGDRPVRQLVVPAGSNRNGSGGNEAVGAFDAKVAVKATRELTGPNTREHRAGLKTNRRGSRPTIHLGKAAAVRDSLPPAARTTSPGRSRRGIGEGMTAQEIRRNT